MGCMTKFITLLSTFHRDFTASGVHHHLPPTRHSNSDSHLASSTVTVAGHRSADSLGLVACLRDWNLRDGGGRVGGVGASRLVNPGRASRGLVISLGGASDLSLDTPKGADRHGRDSIYTYVTGTVSQDVATEV